MNQKYEPIVEVNPKPWKLLDSVVLSDDERKAQWIDYLARDSWKDKGQSSRILFYMQGPDGRKYAITKDYVNYRGCDVAPIAQPILQRMSDLIRDHFQS